MNNPITYVSTAFYLFSHWFFKNLEKAFQTLANFLRMESNIFLLESTCEGSYVTIFLVKEEATCLNRSISVRADAYLESVADIFYLIFNLSNLILK